MEAKVRAFVAALSSQLSYSPSTCLAYQNDLHSFVEYLQKRLDHTPTLGDFNVDLARSFLEHGRQAGLSLSTLIRRRATLRRFAAYLYEQKLLMVDISREVDLPVEAGSKTPLKFIQVQTLEIPDIRRLWAVMEASPRPRARRDQAIFALMLETGLSVAAIVALDITDLDLSQKRLRYCLVKSAESWLPLDFSIEPLQRYLSEGRPELNHHPDETALFISQIGERMSRQGFWQILRHWGRAADLPVTLSPRLTRHTATRLHLDLGWSVGEIQTMLGHTNALSTRALLRRLQNHPEAGEN